MLDTCSQGIATEGYIPLCLPARLVDDLSGVKAAVSEVSLKQLVTRLILAVCAWVSALVRVHWVRGNLCD